MGGPALAKVVITRKNTAEINFMALPLLLKVD